MSESPIVPIIGGGPAGMSCALWLHNYGLRPIIIEKADALGGMARSSPYPNDWLLGRSGETARQNAEALARHIRHVGVETLPGAKPELIRREHDGTFALGLALSAPQATRSVSCKALVLATGTRFRG